jgi:bifunctional UDP-N-acetylglucosamine pyrophosphorylase/glucosamine-1-phosphate N-acetyltransferase
VLEDVGCLILAAGQGKRMKSAVPKVLQKILNRPLAQWVLESAKKCLAQKPLMVVGHGREAVMAAFSGQCGLWYRKSSLAPATP